MELPDPTSSIIVFVLTFCVGYITILIAYYRVGRLSEWLALDVFDKTIVTFIVGGIVTTVSLASLNAPASTLFFTTDTTSTATVFNQLSLWLSDNFGIMVAMELTLITAIILLIDIFLRRHGSNSIDYAV